MTVTLWQAIFVDDAQKPIYYHAAIAWDKAGRAVVARLQPDYSGEFYGDTQAALLKRAIHAVKAAAKRRGLAIVSEITTQHAPAKLARKAFE